MYLFLEFIQQELIHKEQIHFYVIPLKQKMDIKDGVTKLAFHYELKANPDADYNIYALELHEREAEKEQQGGKRLLRA